MTQAATKPKRSSKKIAPEPVPQSPSEKEPESTISYSEEEAEEWRKNPLKVIVLAFALLALIVLSAIFS
jgi:hypothetical protein